MSKILARVILAAISLLSIVAIFLYGGLLVTNASVLIILIVMVVIYYLVTKAFPLD